jgi:hypothetical protein
MYRNRVDTLKNRMYVMFKDKMEVAEIRAACADILQEAKRLKSGFGIISDIGEFFPATEEGRLVLQETMKTLKKEKGMGQVVRVVKASAQITVNQWQRSSRAAGYQAEQAPSVAEADTLMDQLEGKNGQSL